MIVKIFALPNGIAKIFTILFFPKEIFTFRPKCEDLRLTKLSSEDLHILTFKCGKKTFAKIFALFSIEIILIFW